MTTKCEKIYEYDLNVTGVTHYGVTMETILAKQQGDTTARSSIRCRVFWLY
jgi:hypothetical protein